MWFISIAVLFHFHMNTYISNVFPRCVRSIYGAMQQVGIGEYIKEVYYFRSFDAVAVQKTMPSRLKNVLSFNDE